MFIQPYTVAADVAHLIMVTFYDSEKAETVIHRLSHVIPHVGDLSTSLLHLLFDEDTPENREVIQEIGAAFSNSEGWAIDTVDGFPITKSLSFNLYGVYVVIHFFVLKGLHIELMENDE